MRSPLAQAFRFSVIAACSAIVATGCVLDRSAIPPGWGRVQPGQYCPGDTLTASYDFLGSDACATDPAVTCSTYFPTVTLTTASGAFPSPTSLPPGYTGSLAFAATGDSITVGFHSSANPVTIPTDRFEGGSRVFLQRTGVTDVSATARRIVGTQAFEFTHEGMCAGGTPTYGPGELPGPPRLSPNLRLVDLCNTNGVAIVVTLNGSAPGVTYSQTLSPGACLDPTAPGVPGGTDAARVVDVRPVTPDPFARCSALGPNTPPATLRTVAHVACR
ncbi:MAG: hypothetical protein ACTHOH_18640 [Lysobacteraceae bacterium]